MVSKKKGEFNIFLDDWQGTMTGVGITKFNKLNSSQKKGIKEIYNNIIDLNVSQNIYREVINGHKNLAMVVYNIDNKNNWFHDTFLESEFQMLVLFILKRLYPFVDGMKFKFKDATEQLNNDKHDSIGKYIHISWNNISVTKSDVDNCRRLMRLGTIYRPMKWSDVRRATDVIIYTRLMNVKREQMYQELVDAFQKVTNEKNMTVYKPKWDYIVALFTGNDSVDYKNTKCADYCRHRSRSGTLDVLP